MKTKPLASIALVFCLTTPLMTAAETTTTTTETKVTETTTDGTKAPATPAIEKGSLTTVVQDSVTFSILAKALKAAELDLTLGAKGSSYTLFAPTDEAFGKLPKGTLDKLLLPENKEKLRNLLLYHVVPGSFPSTSLKEGELKTMNGEKLKIDIDDGGKEIEVNDAKVFSENTPATNGVMHAIGEVLVPKTLDGFAKLDK